MAESLKPFLAILRDTLDYALNLRNFPSQIYEKINRPQVEVSESLELLNNPIIISKNEDEKIEIEPSINSVRINIVIKKHADLEELLMGIYSNYLMNRADKLHILRKKAKEGYDISFLVTNYHLENYKKEEIIDYIVEFVQDLSKEITEMKLIVNSQSRLVSTNFMEQLKF
jgi:actin related protein 2/3 complex, subunit 4